MIKYHILSSEKLDHYKTYNFSFKGDVGTLHQVLPIRATIRDVANDISYRDYGRFRCFIILLALTKRGFDI